MLQAPRRLVHLGLALALFVGCLAFSSDAPTSAQAPKVKGKHVTLTRALRALRDSRAELKTLEGEYGGHRVKSIKHIDQAIAELEKAIKVAERK